MANYFVNPNGTETYPFDTEEKGAKDVNRLYKYLDNSSSEFINVYFDNYSSAIEVTPNHIAPFPKGSQKVIFKTIVKEHEIMPIYMGEIHGYSNYRLPEGCILGTQNISLSVWSFATVTTWDDSMGRVAYTNHIRKGSNIKTFEKPFDISVSYYWVVDEYFVDMFVVPEDEELDLEAEPEWHNNHGQTNWDSFFGLGYSYQKYASSLIGSISDGRTHIHSMSNYSLDKPAIAITDEDKILLTGDVTETANLNFPDNLNYDKHSFGYALLTSATSVQSETKIKWTLSDSNYYFVNLNLDNLNISTLYGGNEFLNNTRVSNCNFDDTWQWGGISFADWSPYYDVGKTCYIYNNTFIDGEYMSIYNVEDHYSGLSDGHYNLVIYNNIFNNYFMIYCANANVTKYIYNNVFTNNSYINLDIYEFYATKKCVIANNTFTGITDDAIYINYNCDDTLELKIFNNIVDGAEIHVVLEKETLGSNINFLHSNNCSTAYNYKTIFEDYYTTILPNPTEISSDPMFDSENIEHPLMITTDSPCYNTGLSISDTPEFDIIGTTRDSSPDMGAYELFEETIYLDRIKLSSYDGSNPICLPMPQLDNSTEINMAFKVHKTSDMTIRYFDNGQNYDSITSKAKYLLTKEEIDNFIDFFEDQTRGRGNVFRFELSQNSGYYLFGVDLGDTGIFYCKFVDAKWTTRLNKPWGMYELELSLHLVSPPDYEIPTTTYKQGSFILDDLVNLPNPEIQYDYENHLFTITSLGGKLTTIDIGHSNYMHNSKFSFDVSVQNARLLLSKLKSIRTNTFTITTPVNCYPFGSKIGSGSFSVSLLSNTIKITNNGHNNYRVEFQVGLQNVL